jgi:hypothetical protein
MEQGWPRVSLCSQLARPRLPWLPEVGLNHDPCVLPLLVGSCMPGQMQLVSRSCGLGQQERWAGPSVYLFMTFRLPIYLPKPPSFLFPFTLINFLFTELNLMFLRVGCNFVWSNLFRGVPYSHLEHVIGSATTYCTSRLFGSRTFSLFP